MASMRIVQVCSDSGDYPKKEKRAAGNKKAGLETSPAENNEAMLIS